MALPSLIPLVLFALLPVAYVVFLSFTRYNGVTSPQWIGLDNYQLMFKDQSWWQAVLITLVFAVGQIVIGLPLSLLLAMVLNSGIKGMGLFRGLFFLPYVISIAIIGIVFYFLLRPDNGVINGILQALNLLSTDVDWLGSQGTALASLVLVGVWSNFGINMVFFLVALQTVSKDLLESAQLDGANAIQRFRHVSLPLLAPITRVVVVLSIVFSLRSFDLVKTLTDGGRPVRLTSCTPTFSTISSAPTAGASTGMRLHSPSSPASLRRSCHSCTWRCPVTGRHGNRPRQPRKASDESSKDLKSRTATACLPVPDHGCDHHARPFGLCILRVIQTVS